MQRSFPGADRLGSVDDRGTSESKGYLMHQGADGWIHRHQGVNGSEIHQLLALLNELMATTEGRPIEATHLTTLEDRCSRS